MVLFLRAVPCTTASRDATSLGGSNMWQMFRWFEGGARNSFGRAALARTSVHKQKADSRDYGIMAAAGKEERAA